MDGGILILSGLLISQADEIEKLRKPHYSPKPDTTRENGAVWFMVRREVDPLGEQPFYRPHKIKRLC